MRDPETSKILEVFYRRAPNFLTVDNIAYDLPGMDHAAIRNALSNLCEEGIIKERKGKEKIKDDYALPSYDNIPVKEYMSISGIKVPRLISYDRARPEDLNIFFESLAARTASMESEFDRIVEDKLQSYWANIIVLFGIFIGLFSLIVTFVEKIETQAGSGFWEVLLLNTAQVIPIAVVLGGFVGLLR